MKQLSRGLRLLLILSFILVGTVFVVQAQEGGEFKLADRIAAKVASGEPLVIRVSYHDVSNEFAPFIRAGVDKAKADFTSALTYIPDYAPALDALDRLER